MKSTIASVGIAISLLMSGCSSPEDKFRGEFVSGCMQGGADRRICSCAFERLNERYGTEALERMSRRSMPTQEFMEAAMMAGLQCSEM